MPNISIEIVESPKPRQRGSCRISNDWDWLFIPLTEDEIQRYLSKPIKNPCWKIGIQPKQFSHE